MTHHTQPLHNSETVVNALSVDVEEYYHATIFQEATAHLVNQAFPSRVEAQTERLLTLLAEHSVQATFFLLGVVAEGHPQLVKRIAAAGHEIACHGSGHDLLTRLTPAEFRADVTRAKVCLEDLTSQPVFGYRAPSFSIPSCGTWVYEILADLGFRYDSSVYPIVHDRYGQPNAARVPYVAWQHGDRRLIEIPIGTVRIFGFNLPVGGGGYFRLLPLSVFRWGISHVNHRESTPLVFYMHPWELDPDLPRPPIAWRHRFRHYVGLSSVEGKLSRLLQSVRFGPICNLVPLPDAALTASTKPAQASEPWTADRHPHTPLGVGTSRPGKP